MTQSPHVLAFVDIDQSLFAPSVDVHDTLSEQNISLVLCSHMTRAEIEIQQQELGIRQPFVSESGAAVFIPRGLFSFDVPHDRELTGYDVVEFGRPYAEVVDVLHRSARRIGIDIIGFSDLSVEQVATECDLSPSQARLAKLREYDEPFRVVNPAVASRERLFKYLHSARLGCTYRGSYDHVGAPVNKGAIVDTLAGFYRRALGPVVTIGLGDAINSIALLRRVDMPFVVESREDRWSLQFPLIPRLYISPGAGSLIAAVVELSQQVRDRRLRHIG